MDDFREKVLERIKDDACGMGRLCYDSGYCVCLRTADAVIRLCFEEAASEVEGLLQWVDEQELVYALADRLRSRSVPKEPASK